ncbi:GNAT family N-acetyltransferase [Jannaschia marina]|uniref:GNAT family N-acetyltransferase n=1 Tax=Jannaschia marina TaxID=2741674 RepID=UPI0015C90769|nr:GNAT family N-acetyltransferase [Jannaschia marina]
MDSETVDLREIADDDRADWAALWEGYLQFYGTILPAETYEATFAALTDPSTAHVGGRLALIGDTPVGLVHFFHHPHMWRPEGIVYLQDLFTLPEARGRGVARRLIEAVYEQADAWDSPRVYWMTQETNYAGRMLYDRVGRQTGYIKYERAV